jgi:dihydrofolate reductase
MHVFLIAAVTLDGYIAREVGQNSTTWTSPEDTQWFRQRTKEAGAVVMGSKTYDTVGRPMPNRLNVVMTRKLEKYSETADNIWFTNASPQEILLNLEEKGYTEVAICGGSSVYSLFMKHNLIQTLYVTIEPLVFGRGVPLFTETLDHQLRLTEVRNLSEQTLLLEYKVKLPE